MRYTNRRMLYFTLLIHYSLLTLSLLTVPVSQHGNKHDAVHGIFNLQNI